MIKRPTSRRISILSLVAIAETAIALRQPSITQGRTWNLFQGDYIRHPVLYELSSKYGMAGSDQVPLATRLDVLREHIRREIRKVCRGFAYPLLAAVSGKCPFPLSSAALPYPFLSFFFFLSIPSNNQFNVFSPFC